jgi:hypothetical protein
MPAKKQSQFEYSHAIHLRKMWRARHIHQNVRAFFWCPTHDPAPFGTWFFVLDRADNGSNLLLGQRKPWADAAMWRRYENRHGLNQ